MTSCSSRKLDVRGLQNPARTNHSSSGREAEVMTGSPAKGCVHRPAGVSQAISVGRPNWIAPAASMSSRAPGIIASTPAARLPRRRGTWRACGTPLRTSGPSGSRSRSMTVTRSKRSLSAFAVRMPAMLPPMTTACPGWCVVHADDPLRTCVGLGPVGRCRALTGCGLHRAGGDARTWRSSGDHPERSWRRAAPEVAHFRARGDSVYRFLTASSIHAATSSSWR